jgi:hypothetical protein
MVISDLNDLVKALKLATGIKDSKNLVQSIIQGEWRLSAASQSGPYLERVTGEKKFSIGPTSGHRTFGCKDGRSYGPYFSGYFAPEYKKAPGNDVYPQKKLAVEVFSLVRNADLSKIFPRKLSQREKFCLTEDQVISFVEKYHAWLCKGGKNTFFLFKTKNGKFFFAEINKYTIPSLVLSIYPFSQTVALNIMHNHQFVLPKGANG